MLRRLLLTLALAGSLTSPALAFRHVAPGQRVGAVSLQSLEGEAVSLGAESRGRATLVLFWATWSPRSLKALDDFEQLHRRYGAQGLRVVAVNVEGEGVSPETAARISAAVPGITYDVALDRDLALYAAWGVGAVPSSVLLDQGGTVVDAMDGYPPGLGGRIGGLVAGLLGAWDAQPDAAPSAIASRAEERFGVAAR